MRNNADGCYLCEETGGKLRKFTFYSGVRKGGTRHRMVNYTVTFFERWSELTMHDVHVCRDCQQRLWQEKRKKHFVPLAVFGGLAVALLVLALLLVILLPGVFRFVVPGVLIVAGLALGGMAYVHLQKYQAKKPKSGDVDKLVLEAALDWLPHEEHTYMTTDQYAERYEKGVVG